MRLIDADAYAEEMKKRQDACKEWTQRTIDTVDEENYLRSCGAYVVFVEAKLLLENQPTIDAVEAKHGEWIDEKNGYYWFGKCSSCRKEFAIDGWYASDMNYCPNCGAVMKGAER